ncbi:hypothetical protein FHETE_11014 [Fusarium heterosporum]|uniref:Uncharacterized protein n=1 Tax=Fusarium heterosporum TaxID=42747 RepID=A0A8H5SP11_FUSHE|nr:hypothetical protein FHETE_11014 [Fusarium heterosporum]
MEMSEELYDTEKEEGFNSAIKNCDLVEIVTSHKETADSGNGDEGFGEQVVTDEPWMYKDYSWISMDFEDILALNAEHIKDSSTEYQASLEKHRLRPEFYLPWSSGLRVDCQTKQDIETLLNLTDPHELLVIGNMGHFRGILHRDILGTDSNGNPYVWEAIRGAPMLEFLVLKDSKSSMFVERLLKGDKLNSCVWEGRSKKVDNALEGSQWSIEDYRLEEAALFRIGSCDNCDRPVSGKSTKQGNLDGAEILADVYICRVGMKITHELYTTEKEDFDDVIKYFKWVEIVLSHKTIADSGNGNGDCEERRSGYGA